MLEAEVWLDIASRTVLYVPSALRTSAICLLFLVCWGFNIRGFDSSRIPFRAALGFKKHEADFTSLLSFCKLLFVLLLLCFIAHEVLVLEGLPRGGNVPLLLVWISSLLFLGLSSHKTAVEMRSNISDRVIAFVKCKDVSPLLACDEAVPSL